MAPTRPKFVPRKPGTPSVGRRRGFAPSARPTAETPIGLVGDVELAEMLGSLTGKEITCSQGPILTPGATRPVVVAPYLDESQAVGALLVADIAAASSLAGALSLMAEGCVEDACRAGSLDESLMENWQEIGNVLTQVVRIPEYPQLSLGDSVQSSTGLSPAVDTLLGVARIRADWLVDVPGYGKGAMAILFRDA